MVLQNKRMKLMDSCMIGKAAPDWSGGLPKHIMDLILDNLISHVDYIRFACVCWNWCSIATEDRNNRNVRRGGICRYHHHQLPMLMIPNVDKGVYNRSLYSVTGDRVLECFRLTISYPFRQIGSCFGWLISLDREYAINLYNPFSASTIRILPPLWESNQQIRDMYGITCTFFNTDYLILKAVLSADPALYPNDYVLMLLHGPGRRSLAFTAPGCYARDEWFQIESKEEFEDVIYSAADGLFYAVDTNGQVTSFDVNSELHKITKSPFRRHSLPALTPPVHAQMSSSPFSDTSRYLLESSRGDLLQVVRFKGWEKGSEWDVFTTSYSVSEFSVFRFCRTSQDWVQVKSLGDDALFLGDNSSASVLTSDFPGCRPGSIYYSFCYRFSPSLLQWEPPYIDSAPFDMGVVNLESGRRGLHMCPDGDVTNMMRIQTPTWLVPTIQEPHCRGRSASSVKQQFMQLVQENHLDLTRQGEVCTNKRSHW